jgi:nucleoside-diphosphate-sugar epimerase
MTVLVTGGTGFLGSHIAEQLAKRGRKVRALVRKTSDTRFLSTLENVELCEGSVDDRESLVKAAEGAEAIVHSAGLVKARGADEFMAVNAGGTENAVFAALQNRATVQRFVLVSSQSVGGPSDAQGTPLCSNVEPRPITNYGRSKLAAELAALAHKDELPLTILRPSAIYGPRDREILVFFKSVAKGVLPLTNPEQAKVSMIYAGDCAEACVLAIDADLPSGSTFFLDDGTPYTFRYLVEQVEQAVGKRAWLRIPLPKPIVLAAATATELYGRVTNRAVMFTRDKCNELFEQWVCESSDARQALGWQPKTELSNGLRVTADWYRQAGWL